MDVPRYQSSSYSAGVSALVGASQPSLGFFGAASLME